jgi:hypothetical protein
MSNLERDFLEIMSQSDDICSDKEQLNSFEEAMATFDDLISRGLAKSRGYNLQTIEDYGNTLMFNVTA